MKTERRHDLETNVLASTMAEWINHVKPYTTAIWAVVVVGLVVVIGSYIVAGQSSKREAAAWTDYYNAVSGGRLDIQHLREIAETHSGTAVEEWANIVRADIQLRQASMVLFANGPAADKLLEDARSTYISLQNNASDPAIRSRASYGLGRAFEMKGRLDKAKEQYADVTGIFGQLASARMQAIEEDETKDFYDWFVVAQPTGVTIPKGPGTPGNRPLFEPDSLGTDGSNDEGRLFQPGFGLDLDEGEADSETESRYSPSTDEQSTDEQPTDEQPADNENDPVTDDAATDDSTDDASQ